MSLFRGILPGKLTADDRSLRVGRRKDRFKPRTLRCETLEIRRLLVAEGAVHSVSGIYDAAGVVGDVSAMVRWGDGTTTPATNTGVTSSSKLRIRFDYSLDTGGFFSGANQSRRTVLQFAADSLVSRFSDDLAAITPGGYNQWTPSVFHPSQGPADQLTGTLTPLAANLPVAANEIIIYVGARNLPGANRGVGGPASYRFPAQQISCQTQAQCDQILAGIDAFQDLVRGRGEPGGITSPRTDVAPQIGTISFDTDTNWHFGLSADGIQPAQVDFLSVAVHEIAHVLGFGITQTDAISSWANLTSTGVFTGPKARAAYQGSGNVPVVNNHWAPSVLNNVGQSTLMAAEIATGVRQLFTSLDFAAMDDLGWDVLDTRTTVGAEHRYADDGVFPVELILKGSKAGEVVHPISDVTVTNVAPTLTVVGTQTVTVGQTLNITNIGEIVDPGFANSLSDPASTEAFAYTINWGDGSEIAEGTATIDSQGNATGALTNASFDAAHTYDTAGTKTVTIAVTDDDGGSAQKTFTVIVEPLPALTLELTHSSISEADGDNATTLTIRRSGPVTGSDQTINLSSSDTSEATVPATAVIPGDATFTTVAVKAVDDALLDGDITLQLSAQAGGLDPDAIDLIVTDRETLTASFAISEIREDATSPVNLIVRRSNTDGDQELVVNVSGGNAAELNVPSTVTIAANEQQVSVPITPVADDDPEPRMTFTYSFTAANYPSVSAEIVLVDDEAPLFQNPVSQYDVNNNGDVTAGDALRVINQMNARGGPSELNPEAEQPNGVYYDPNGDYRITALDALVIINELARRQNSQSSQSELVSPSVATYAFSQDRDDEEAQLGWEFSVGLS